MKTKHIIKKSALFVILATFLCGIIYPLTMTGISVLTMSDQAHGSLIKKDGEVIGSKLIAQEVKDPRYFIGRPDTGAPNNLGYKSNDLEALVENRVSWWNEFDPNTIGEKIPDDLIYSSASGVDPNISVEAALFQCERIAKERGLSKDVVVALIEEHTSYPLFGFIGEECVNVLELNLALDL